MGRSPNYTFLQKRQKDGQKAHEKMLNAANCQRNATQNYNEVSFHTSQNGCQQKVETLLLILTIINAEEGVEKREPSYTVGANVSQYSHYGQYGDTLTKPKIELPYDLAIPLMGIEPEKTIL